MTPPTVTETRTQRAGLSELDVLAPLFDGYRVFYGQPSDLAAARAFLSARLEHEESVVLLAWLGNVPAGFTQLYPSFSSVRLARLWILNDLFVAPPARRQGVAAALLEAARHHAAALGARRLTLQTATDNHAAQSLYEAHGWQRDQTFLTYNLEVAGGES